jgi:D-lactate dehydrogenase (cytochrome)
MSNRISAVEPRKDADQATIEKTTDVRVIENYCNDESRIITGYAEAVCFPRSEEQIARILREADQKSIKVTISGAGTGITGSRVPQGGIVLSTERMTTLQGTNENVIKYQENGVQYSVCITTYIGSNEYLAIAPPGIPLEILKKIIETRNLHYPPDPTETTALLGGTVATNASGARTFKYGSTRDYVRRLRIVLSNGDVLEIKRGQVFADDEGLFIITLLSEQTLVIKLPSYVMPNVKNAAGYYVEPRMDLIDLFIGSEGTLGVISEVEVRLTESPKVVIPIFASFEKEQDSLKFVRKLREAARSGNINVLSIEFFDRNSVDLIRQKYPPPKVPEKSQGLVFFEQEVPSQDEMVKFLEQTASLLERCKVSNTLTSTEPDWKRESKEMRHALPEQVNSFIRSHGGYKVATDIVVPDVALDTMMETYHKIGDELGIPYVIFGHIGDNHLHFNFLPRNKEELKAASKACTILLRKAVELGGTISGEHGVGKKTYVENEVRKPYLEIMYGREGLSSIAQIKRALDPNRILNVGNIVPMEYLKC